MLLYIILYWTVLVCRVLKVQFSLFKMFSCKWTNEKYFTDLSLAFFNIMYVLPSMLDSAVFCCFQSYHILFGRVIRLYYNLIWILPQSVQVHPYTAFYTNIFLLSLLSLSIFAYLFLVVVPTWWSEQMRIIYIISSLAAPSVHSPC